MKKKYAISIAVFIIMIIFAGLIFTAIYTDVFENVSNNYKSIRVDLNGDSVGKISYKTDNSYRENTACYLTEDKFIYSVLDESTSNTFGSAAKLVIYDFNTGKAEYPINSTETSLSDIDNIYLIDNELIFTAYAYTEYYEDINWGFCLFSLNMNTYELKTIFQTPNTVDLIKPCVIDNALYYFASTMTLAEHEKEIEMLDKYNNVDFHNVQLRCYKNGTDIIIKSGLSCDYERCLVYADKSIYLVGEDIIAFNTKGEEIKISKKKANEIKKTVDSTLYSEEPVENGLFARFGDYEIIRSDIKKFNENDCGYKYSCRYYLKDTKTDNSFRMSEGAYWYYYI